MAASQAKAVQAYLGIFTHIPVYSDCLRNNQTYSGIIQAYSHMNSPCAYSESCVILAYSKPWYIQNPGTPWKHDAH